MPIRELAVNNRLSQFMPRKLFELLLFCLVQHMILSISNLTLRLTVTTFYVML